MTSGVKGFQIVTAESSDGLAEKILELMKQGWERDGPLQTRDWVYGKGDMHPSYWRDVTTYMQPMVLKEKA